MTTPDTPSAARRRHPAAVSEASTVTLSKRLSRYWVKGYLDGFTGSILKAEVDLDQVLDLSAEYARRNAGMLIRGSVNTRVVQSIMRRAFEEGWSQKKIERAIQRSVGLSGRDAQSLFNYEKQLIDSKVPDGRRRRMVKEQEGRLRSARTKMIARNETALAMAAGKREAWRQMQTMGEVSPYAVRIWHTHKDERTCPVCAPLNGRRASLHEERGYTLKDGLFVTGPPAHPNCRCWETLSDRGTPEVP